MLDIVKYKTEILKNGNIKNFKEKMACVDRNLAQSKCYNKECRSPWLAFQLNINV